MNNLPFLVLPERNLSTERGNIGVPSCTVLSSKEKEWPQILAIITVSLAGISMGLLLGWPSPSIPILLSGQYSEMTLSQVSYLAVLPYISLALASPLFAVLPNRMGRKYCLLVFTAGPQLASWILIANTTAIQWLYLSRIITGIADSCVFAVMPMYIGEISTPKVRGSWGNCMVLSILVGQFVINAVGAFFSIKLTAIISATVPILFLCTFSFMPESPYHLIIKGREEQAKQTLKWLRYGKSSCPELVDTEFRRLSGDIAKQLSEPGRYRDLFTIASNRKALSIGASARFSQQYCGLGVFNAYIKYFFDIAGGSIGTTTATLLFVGAYVICSVTGSAISDKIGRMKAMTISCSLTCITLSSLVVFFYLKDHSAVNLAALLWFPLAAMLLYVITLSVGLATVPTMLLGELFSASVKGKALCIMNVCFSLFAASSLKIFQVLLSIYGLYIPLAFFAVVCLTNSVLSYFIIPDTSGKTLQEIQDHFKKGTDTTNHYKETNITGINNESFQNET